MSRVRAACPSCGIRLRITAPGDLPERVQVRCSSCQAVFVVRCRQQDTPDSDFSSPGVSRTGILEGQDPSPPPSVEWTPATAGRASVSEFQETTSLPRPEPSSAGIFAPGAMLAERFRIVRFIASGGMGEVYEAEDLELGESVAVKTVRPDLARDETAVERFKREIQLARKVTHPNVCRIFDVYRHREDGDHGDVLFLSMELLPGESLAERLQRSGPMSTEQALPIVRQMAEGLEAAHHAGVVHRDFKTGNVQLVQTGNGVRAVVTDFGLARTAEGSEAMALTQAGGVIGTPAYMAPEQVEGGTISRAVDVYALGVVMYEMLTGQVPFQGETALSTAVKRLREPPPSPRVRVPDLDPTWEETILRCLERHPAQRFRRATDVARALTGGELPARRASAVPREPRRPVRRGVAVLGLMAIILLSFGVAYRRYLDWKSQSAAIQQVLGVPTGSVVARQSVAVLGFKNLSGSSETEWLSTALAEMLSTELGAGDDLRIIAGENVARAKMELALDDADSLGGETLEAIRRVLGTDYVVLGSYTVLGERPGRRIRLDLRLQDTAAGETVAHVPESGTEKELFELVARAGGSLRDRLGMDSSDGSRKAMRAVMPSTPEAARLYSEGLAKLRSFEPGAARDLLEHAAAIEPQNPVIHSALAAAWSTLGYDAKAKDAAKRALDLAASLPQAERLSIEARYLESLQDWTSAVEIYRQLWSAYPDNLDYGLRLATAQTMAGRARQALASTAALRSLPPPAGEDPRIDLTEATAAGALADFERQERTAARAAATAEERGARLLVAQARLSECQALRNLGQGEGAMAACDEAREIYRSAGDRSGVADATTNMANVLYDQGELDGARDMLEQALVTYRELGNQGAAAAALNNIAVVRRNQGELEPARDLYEEVLDICRETGNRVGEAHSLNNIAAVLIQKGVLGEAKELLEEARAIRSEMGDRAGEAFALDNIGVVLRRQGSLEAAKSRHDEALGIRREIGQRSGEVASLNNLAKVLHLEGDLAGANRRFREALVICREIGHRSFSADALHGLGEILVDEGNVATAMQRHEDALSIREELGERGAMAESRVALARIWLEEGEPTMAEGLARQAVEEFRRQQAVDNQVRALTILARTVRAQGRRDEALKTIGEAERLAKRSENRSVGLAAALEAARIEAALGRPGESAKALAVVLGEARELGLLGLELESRLALAELAVPLPGPLRAEARLATLVDEARQRGFLRIAERAGSLSQK